MREEKEHLKLCNLRNFTLVIFSFLLLIGLSIYYLPNAISIMIQNANKELPIYCVDCKEKKISLSFDATEGNEDTKDILSILKKHNVKVTFFMTGEWIEKYPDDVKAIAADGHDLGNHSENHKQMSQLTKEQCIEEIKKPHEKVKKLTGKDMILFRPPYGDYNNTLIEATKAAGYHCIWQDVDSLDWKDYGVDSIINTITNHPHLGNGSIILCHNGTKFTKDALESIITALQDKGYELVPISQLIYKENYKIDHEGRQQMIDTN